MYDAFKTLLWSTGIAFAEGDWNKAPETGSYAAIALDLEGDTLWGDGGQRQQAIQGTINLFCRTPDMADFRRIQTALKRSGISWDLNSIQRETGRRLYHYEWVFELESVDPEADALFYEQFPGLQVYYEDGNISAPSATMDGEYVVIDPLGLYVDEGEDLTQRLLEDV